MAAYNNPSQLNDPAGLLSNVFNALKHHASNDIFAIGGALDLDPTQEPFTVRWDSGKREHGRKVSLPLKDDEISRDAFQQLLDDCQPATFGKGDEEVFDTQYRKAGKMDVDTFCTNFNLASTHIMYTVSQALVQSTHLDSEDEVLNGVVASLYSLNIYSEPAGKFKAHVDTPRSESQMGSLVICLPYPHKGGALAVRHEGKEVIFDWSLKSSNSIQWAAFFSDCEHEVLEVVEGHRLTLTYNLFWSNGGPSIMATRPEALDTSALHFYAALEQLYQCPSFLPKGGRIGFSCTHGYPHTSDIAIDSLHDNLKGLDMAVYRALERLNGEVSVLAVLDATRWEEYIAERGYPDDEASDTSDGSQTHLTEELYLSRQLVPTVFGEETDEDQEMNPEHLTYSRKKTEYLFEEVPYFPRTQVVWLNGRPQSFQELAAVYIAYGNQPSVDAFYSAAVVISKVPGFEERKSRWMNDSKVQT